MRFKITLAFIFLIGLSVPIKAQSTRPKLNAIGTLPLKQNPYLQLPLGAIKPNGWLKEMLIRQKDGSTGQLDQLYPLVMGKRNGWLGGDGDQWERGPYWIDGLLPLAYLLNDKVLIDKVQPWIEWSLKSQTADGNFGPSKDYPNEPGIQRSDSQDWWPKMVMLKIMMQYYGATNDQRIIPFLNNYFSYQLKTLPKKPLGYWTRWAPYRAGDNLMVVYWLYNKTKAPFLLQLGELLHQQTFDFTNAFLNTNLLSEMGSIHTVNLSQGMKEPLIYYQQHREQKYLDALKKGFEDLRSFNGMAHGLYGGDETLHGNDPTQGSELCTAVEMMFTLENALEITGDVAYADHLEHLAFNALPAQISDDFMTRQYFQQANQVMVTKYNRNFSDNHGGTDINFGLLSGYPCCTSNMHQGWPKFAQNLWYATADHGVAALVYSQNELNTTLVNGTQLKINETTNYPFDENIKFTITTSKTVTFPFHLRIPAWCKQASIKINGKMFNEVTGNQIIKINRTWNTGDVVELVLPMHLYKNTWYQNSISIERGPLTYALKIGEETKKIKNQDSVKFGLYYFETRPTTAWNYALYDLNNEQLATNYIIKKNTATNNYPWNLENAPIQLTTKGKRINNWKLYNEMAGPIPYSRTNGLSNGSEEEIMLVPYGCTILRISQFPTVKKY